MYLAGATHSQKKNVFIIIVTIIFINIIIIHIIRGMLLMKA